MLRALARSLKWIAAAAAAVVLLWFVWTVYAAGQVALAAAFLAVFALAFYVYLAPGRTAWRYLFPGLAGMAVFVVLPLLYTVRIGFTNYSSRNLLTFERATRYLLDETVSGDGPRYTFTLHDAGAGGVRLLLEQKPPEEPVVDVEEEPAAELGAEAEAGEAAPAPASAPAEPAPPAPVLARYVTPAWSPAGGAEAELEAAVAREGAAAGAPLPLKEVIRLRAALARVKVKLPDGSQVTMVDLREFGPVQPAYRQEAPGRLVHTRSGEVLTANFESGFYETSSGEHVRPGFKVDVAFGNYARLATDPEFRGPFVSIFLWTVLFAGLTVLFTLCVGATLAVILSWEALPGRGVYRTLVFLPYAVPGFISILVFRGLFNQNFGEINHILDGLFGIRPAWFADPLLARCMILIVNTWLGYPYVLVLCTGLIKAIPADLYEASAMAGAGPIDNFVHVTAPLIIKPLTPLLIASFAFNFNNYVLISLLTRGRPDFLNTRVPAGTTDILVTYTSRIAFEDSGQQFGLAAAISTLIFLLVALLSVVNLKLTRANAQEAR